MSQLDEAFDSLVDMLKVKSTRKERRELLVSHSPDSGAIYATQEVMIVMMITECNSAPTHYRIFSVLQ